MEQNNTALSAFEEALNRLTETSLGRRTFLASIPLLVAACSSDNHRTREGDNTGQATSLTVADEQAMTKEALPTMRHDYPPLQDAEVQRYVSSLGTRLVAANGLIGHPYQYSFTVVDVPMVNAFALPAGTVFVTAPLLAMAESEAELAGVIGHEIGHVKARHVAERMEAQKSEGTKSWIYGVGGGILGGAAGFGLGKLVCKGGDNACLAQTTALGAAAGVGGGLLIKKYKFMANSREDEMEADRIGFKTAVRAGYTPTNAGAFYSKLLKLEEQSKHGGSPLLSSLGDAMATHPPSQERVAQMNQLISQSPKNQKSITNTVQFDRTRLKVQTLEKSRPKA
jgi:predicted Zn-dependent protease